MESVNITLSAELKRFVDDRLKQTKHATLADYIQSLVQKDQKSAEQEALAHLLASRATEGAAIEIDDLGAYIESKRELARAAAQRMTAK